MTKAAELAKMGEVLTNSQIGGRRNMIINGAMQVAQRGTSLAMAHDGNTGNYLIDRFQCLFGGSPSSLDGTFAQVDDHPLSANGKSLKWTTGTAESAIASDELLFFTQKVEAQNLQHLQFGNSNALTTSLSFYVKCSITGTFSISLRKDDTTRRISNRTYTINSANTWEKKTFTFTGDTDSGAGIVNDSGEGIRIMWHLMAGSNSVGGGNFTSWKDYAADDFAAGLATNAIATTASATWQLADVQWEVGQATPFEHRSFGEELELCKRYYHKLVATGPYQKFAVGVAFTTDDCMFVFKFNPEMRGVPTLDYGTLSKLVVTDNDLSGEAIGSLAIDTNTDGPQGVSVKAADITSDVMTAGDATILNANNDVDAFLAFDAEL
jgi:hypothetical protein